MKFKDRSELFYQIHASSADIHCLQEVDRWEGHETEHRRYLEQIAPNTYEYLYKKGYEKKKHGLLIMWKKDKFTLIKDQLVKLDDEIYKDGRTGLSRVTRNIGLCVALQSQNSSKGG